jgi:hypothetical protein
MHESDEEFIERLKNSFGNPASRDVQRFKAIETRERSYRLWAPIMKHYGEH